MEWKSAGACDLCERVAAGELRKVTHDVVTGPGPRYTLRMTIIDGLWFDLYMLDMFLDLVGIC